MPKTFVPKDDGTSARQKKLSFLSSDVLPHTAYRNSPQGGYATSPRNESLAEGEYAEEINPHDRRQLELSSELFGRETPACTADSPSKRLTPSDFKWFSVPEPQASADAKDMTYQDRSYHEKCSQLFDHKSPQASPLADKQEEADEAMGELKRRANVYYSDLFGRNTPMAEPGQGDQRHPKLTGPMEDKIVVHQDWTDSRTELMCGARDRPGATPNVRKSNEFNQQRIFVTKDKYTPPEHMAPVQTDNSGKVKDTFGRSTQEIHQAHLQSSNTPKEFYEEAASTKHWEVIELHISGLRDDADDNTVKNLCRDFDLQIVKVNVEMDPVRNLCKGRAKIMVRYNPLRDSIAGLVQKLQSTKLRVEL